MKPSDKITAHWSATVVKGRDVMVSTTVASGTISARGSLNKSKALRVIQNAVDTAKMGNVVRLSITIQPIQLR